MTFEKKIEEALINIRDFEGKGNIVSSNRVESIAIEGSSAKIILNLPTRDREEKFRIEDETREVVKRVSGIGDVMIVTRGADTLEPEDKVAKKAQNRKEQKIQNPFDLQAAIPGIGNTIAVASGKGGVGKSTVCINLALALRAGGFCVGLLDADIYGPSLGVLLDVNERPSRGNEKEIAPVEKEGLKLMSIAFLTDPGTPVIWRGPLVMGVVKKFLQDVEWGELDYLLIDLPPGTGDAQLTLVQTIPLSAAIIVTTPSDLALVDAEKGLKMFTQLNVPVLGIIENMSYFVCPHCGKTTDVFSSGGGKEISEKLHSDFLGSIPLDSAVRAGGDMGKPVVLTGESKDIVRAFHMLADKVARACPVVVK